MAQGAPTPAPEPPPVDQVTAGATAGCLAMGGLALVVLLAVCTGGDDTPREPDRETQDITYTRVQREKVSARLRDPKSAQFRNVRLYRASGVRAVCGEVNAKNAFGAYTGFERFISGDGIPILESDMAPGEMEKAWAQACR